MKRHNELIYEKGGDFMVKKIEPNDYDETVDGFNKQWIKAQYEEIKKGDSSAILVHMNIKNFRYYNALHGMVGANELLKIIYNALDENLKENECLAHLNGDNFVFILLYKNQEKYEDFDDYIAKRMYEMTDILFLIDDPRIYRNLFCSFGVLKIKDYQFSFDEALQNANIARKECLTIKNRSFCYEIFNEHYYSQFMDRCDLEKKTAEAYKNEEFTTFLQPKMNPITNQIVGAEALLRWFDENGKMIPVSEFLPILNSNAYIYLVDLGVFEHVCRILHENILVNQPVVPISFNLSRSWFYYENSLQPYLDICQKYDIPKHLIEFELMESITLDDVEQMKAKIHEITEAGFKCSLDDFGSGYSSFNVLLNAKLSIVKMDRQFFLKNMNGNSKTIIQVIVKMIKSLDMMVVAEGVETKEYADFLSECGCDMIQGYYYHKPMPIDEFNQLLLKQEMSRLTSS